eukprot:8252783-Heterocapsa_arctica.AAC.1
MNIISEEANALLTRKPPTTKTNDCEEELAEIIANRQLALIQNNTEEVEANFQNDKWDPIKMYKKGYIPKHTKLKDLEGQLVNDRKRPDTFAEYDEK